jgi:5-methylthioadenosine/S-adenosylhomocysteine deaminase
MTSILIKGATIVAMDPGRRVFQADVLVEQTRISQIGAGLKATADEVIDARNRVLLPGFVQSHVHLCQTLFRGAADDLSLIDWLKKRIWPLEASHTPDSLFASARLGILELIRGGTTCALTMETVHHTDAVFRAVEETGFRAVVGKCMMDKGEDVPEGLREATDSSVAESVALLDRWHGKAGDRIRYCFAPRFAVSCTSQLLKQIGELARKRAVLIHTHASESKEEIEIVFRETGYRNVEYLDRIGLTAPNLVLAHCVHLDDSEIEILRARGVHVSHCPSSNLKLGSGIAPVTELLDRGVSVSLGADGAPCNNRLDMFTEMRTAALMQKVLRGPQAIPALTALQMATIGGARALGLSDTVGSIEVGKQADLILLNLDSLHSAPAPDVVSAIVYSAQTSDVETVLIAGQIVVRDGRPATIDAGEVISAARAEADRLFRAASISI